MFSIFYKGKTFAPEFLLFLAIDDRATEERGEAKKENMESMLYLFQNKGMAF